MGGENCRQVGGKCRSAQYEEERVCLQTMRRGGGQIYRLRVGEGIYTQQEEGKADLHSRRREGRSIN